MALSAAQRLHFDVYGYVLLQDALQARELGALRAALRRLAGEPDPAARGVYHWERGEHYRHFGHLVEYDPAFLDYAAHPALLSAVREVVGGSVRVEETEAIVNRRDPAADVEVLRQRGCTPLGFHTGAEHGWGTFEQDGRFHCLFVKTLAYLTDVGPEDGGTAVIPGSHRLSFGQAEIVAAAQADPPALIRQIEARAGAVLLFAESLIHSTTAILGDRERLIVVTGYVPTMLQVWPGNELSPGFLAGLPAGLRTVLQPDRAWPWERAPAP